MSSITEQVQALLEAPDPSASHARVRQFMDGVYLSFDPLESLDEAASQANRDSIELRDQVRGLCLIRANRFERPSSAWRIIQGSQQPNDLGLIIGNHCAQLCKGAFLNSSLPR